MSTAPSRKSATIADLVRLRDEGRAVELVDGEIVEKATPTAEHGLAQAKSTELLGPFNRDPTNQTLTVMRWAREHYLRVLDAGRGDVVRAEPFDAIELPVSELLGVE